jgi:hypothetical protein
MIPDVKAILEMLEADQCSKGQALAWLEEHMRMERETYMLDLRDDFAGKALQGMMTQWAVADNELPEYRDCAKAAYAIADRMIEVRGSTPAAVGEGEKNA